MYVKSETFLLLFLLLLLNVQVRVDSVSRFSPFLRMEISSNSSRGSAFSLVKIQLLLGVANTLIIGSMLINDERTMFVESIVQLWKYFGNITGFLSFI